MAYNKSSSSSPSSTNTLPELILRTTRMMSSLDVQQGNNHYQLTQNGLRMGSALSGHRSGVHNRASCLQIIEAALQIIEQDDDDFLVACLRQ
mmetsp:Transcript_103657/g.288783  ORF Transcript_103657/g.288783 Transcript_103657/m.288783 type:complete len:92 (-) Transcript_103657:438-713(-)